MTRQRAQKAGAAVAALVGMAGLVVGCSTSGSSPSPRSTLYDATPSSTTRASPLPPRAYPSPPGHASPALVVAGPSSVNGSDASAVALAAICAIESSDTAVDADPHATVQRARAWLTPAFAEQVRRYPAVAAPGAQWNTWSTHRAYVQVATSLGGDDQPEETGTHAYRQVIAVLHPIGRDGWRGQPQRRVVFVTLTRTPGAPWRIASEQAS
jgi:hypothetical protein